VRLQQKPSNPGQCSSSSDRTQAFSRGDRPSPRFRSYRPAAFNKSQVESGTTTQRQQNKKNTQMSTTAIPVAQAAPKSQTLTYGLVIILLTLGMLFLVNRVKSLDLRLRNTEHLVRDLVTEDDVSELWGNFLKDKTGSLLWTEADIRSMIDEHIQDAMSACQAKGCCAGAAETPQSPSAAPATAPSSS